MQVTISSFRLFSVETGGAAIGTLQRPGVVVSNGVFSVKLDYGSGFPGANRWLEIAVRPAGGGAFTTLNPRQSVSSVPYSIRTLSSANADNATTATNSLQLGGVAANQFVITTDPRMTDDRNPLPNSTNYVRNGTTQQAASNFNVAGDGTANNFNAVTQYNIGGSRVLTTSSFFGNLFVGIGSGTANTTGGSNTFVGNQAGQSNVTGTNNSFFGKSAGNSNAGSNNSFFGEQSGFGTFTGGNNSFFGQFSGRNNQTGSDNAFFGYRAGQNNTASGNSFFGSGAGDSVTSGANNAFFGRSAGAAVNTGSGNSFFGFNAGLVTTATGNSFFGSGAGDTNTTGVNNTIIGENADVGVGTLSNATAIGSNAQVTQSNSLVLGNGVNVGIGTSSPDVKLHVAVGSDAEPSGGGYFAAGLTTSTNVVIDNNEIMARNAGATATLALNADGGNVNLIQAGTGNVGIGTSSPGAKLDVAGNVTQDRTFSGLVKAMVYVGADGSISRCYNGIINSSTGNCGLTVVEVAVSATRIDFGFRVDDRFALVLPMYQGGNSVIASIDYTSANVLRINYQEQGGGYPPTAFQVFIF